MAKKKATRKDRSKLIEKIGIVAAYLKAEQDNANRELTERHLPPVGSVEALLMLGRIIELPDAQLDQMTYADIFEHAIAWAERQKIKAKLTADTQKPPSPPNPPFDCTAYKPSKNSRRLIELVSSKKRVTFNDAGDSVWGDDQTDPETIEKAVQRANEAIKDSPFRIAILSGVLYWE